MVFAGRHSKIDALVIELSSGSGGALKTKSLSPAPRDTELLLVRAGPDAPRLSANARLFRRGGHRIPCRASPRRERYQGTKDR